MKLASRRTVIRLLALTLLTSIMFAQTTNETPGKGTASIQTALDEAKDALKHYQTLSRQSEVCRRSRRPSEETRKSCWQAETQLIG